ncbi:Uncharacterised protein [Dermatophilus congolensis]|uniref:DUF4921 domain-containing protein n=1 Tax=Dermatophilus congolensis TaxID=1863 RepID=A0AA46BPF5_9MICO|nr:Uncharacterised protein [Dermatophilus congolensis]
MDGPVEPVRCLADGTVKQVNPFSGTQVWTVPGRALRPVGSGAASVGGSFGFSGTVIVCVL